MTIFRGREGIPKVKPVVINSTLRKCALLAVSFAFILTCLSLRADEATVRKAISTQYLRWSKAYVKNDVPVLLDILSSDFKLKTETGKVLSRKQYEAILHKRKSKTPEQLKYSIVIEKLSVKGRVATVYSKETQSETDESVNPETVSHDTHVHIYLDRWIRVGKEWKMQYSETLKEIKE